MLDYLIFQFIDKTVYSKQAITRLYLQSLTLNFTQVTCRELIFIFRSGIFIIGRPPAERPRVGP